MILHHKLTHEIKKHHRRVGTILAGHTLRLVEEYLFDWLLYGYVIATATAQYGALQGSVLTFAVMTPLSALLCWLYIVAYDWAKKDLFGFEILKEIRDAETGGFFNVLFGKALRLGNVPAFFALSIHTDPFMTTIYFRKHGHEHKGLTGRDWQIFWASVIFSNLFWTLQWTVLVQIVIFIWHFIGAH